jgi:catechol 2,3-dioxygenase-like lactoylglutathione lyase family enzyme
MQSRYGQQGGRLPRLQHTSLPITNGSQDAIRAFYGGLLGLKEKPVPVALAGRGLVWFEAGDYEMELHFVPDRYLANPNEGRHICLEVEDVESYRSKIADAGYQIRETTPIFQRPRFFTNDPCGNSLELTTILADYLQPGSEDPAEER